MFQNQLSLHLFFWYKFCTTPINTFWARSPYSAKSFKISNYYLSSLQSIISPLPPSHSTIFQSMAVSESRKTSKNARKNWTLSHYSPKLSIYLLAICVILLVIFEIKSLHAQPPSLPWNFMHQWQTAINSSMMTSQECTQELKTMTSKLQSSVTFLPLKDLRYSSTAQQGHTWFMSSMHDTHKEGEVQYQKFPSKASKGRLLCLKGNDTHDGSWNSYALAWPQTLPENATLLKGLTFVSYNHYNYDNIWHGLSAMVPFVAWHIKNQCAVPRRWILYHWGELRTKMGPWLTTLMEATYGEALIIEKFDGIKEGNDQIPACFEEAVVMRHNEGGMSREKRIEVYDLLRCKARAYCNVSLEGRVAEVNEKGVPVIGMTMFMRIGPRSFKNDRTVIGIFDKACRKVEGCRLLVAYSNNLTFCEQVLFDYYFSLLLIIYNKLYFV